MKKVLVLLFLLGMHFRMQAQIPIYEIIKAAVVKVIQPSISISSGYKMRRCGCNRRSKNWRMPWLN
jgi:hypothetical protein